jgi:hypothetical protein
MDRCRPDEGEQADVNKNESKIAEALTICNLYTLLALFARSTMRTTSDMMRFNSKSFGVYPLSWQKRTSRGCVAMSANDPKQTPTQLNYVDHRFSRTDAFTPPKPKPLVIA